MNARLDATSFAALERAEEQLRNLQRTLKIVRAPTSDPLRDYSLSRAILWCLGRQTQQEAGLEMFVHDEYQRAGHKPTANRSVLVPSSVLTRALQPYQTTVAGAGAELVETTLLSGRFIDVLRTRSVIGQLGAQFIPGMKGDVQIPRETTASVGDWLTASGSPVQSGAITESEAVFDATPLQVAPCQIGGYGRISRLLLQQSPLADAVISNDLTQVLATALDTAAIQGAGSGGAPLGITNQPAVNTFSGASFNYSNSVSALTALTTANAVVNRRTLGWAAAPTVAGALTQRFKVPTYSFSPIWGGNADTGEINGHPALASNNVPSGTAIFGDWSQLMVFQWGDADEPIEVEINQFGVGFSTGDVMIRAMLSANLAVRHAQSFSVITGIT